MKIWTKIVWDMETMQVVEREGYDYDGPVVGCKGAAKENLALQNKALGLATDQSNKQNAILQPVNDAFRPYLQHDIGMSPAEKALMNSQLIQQNAQRYDQAGTQVMSTLARRNSGIDGPVGGDWGKYLSALKGQQASDLSNGLQNINLQDAQMAIANRFNAGALLNHSASIYNPAPYLNLAGTANTNYTQAVMQPSPWMGVLGAGLGAAGSFFSGGFSSLGGAANGGLTGADMRCWLARAIYGVRSVKWLIARLTLEQKAEKSFVWRKLFSLYLKHGERLSQTCWAPVVFRPIFDMLVA